MADRKRLISQLENVKNNYILVLAACSCFSNKKAYEIFNESQCNFGTYGISFAQVGDMMKNPQDREIAINEFIRMGMRALVKESFELVKEFCIETNQNDKMKNEGWYQFARLMRNGLSHNFKFIFSGHDIEILPVNWKGKTISKDMNGADFNLSFFGYVEAWELFIEFQEFVNYKLK